MSMPVAKGLCCVLRMASVPRVCAGMTAPQRAQEARWICQGTSLLRSRLWIRVPIRGVVAHVRRRAVVLLRDLTEHSARDGIGCAWGACGPYASGAPRRSDDSDAQMEASHALLRRYIQRRPQSPVPAPGAASAEQRIARGHSVVFDVSARFACLGITWCASRWKARAPTKTQQKRLGWSAFAAVPTLSEQRRSHRVQQGHGCCCEGPQKTRPHRKDRNRHWYCHVP